VLTLHQLPSTAGNSIPGSLHGNTFAGDLFRSRRPVLTGPKDSQVQVNRHGAFRLKVPIDKNNCVGLFVFLGRVESRGFPAQLHPPTWMRRKSKRIETAIAWASYSAAFLGLLAMLLSLLLP
jgi:hypothetical protein